MKSFLFLLSILAFQTAFSQIEERKAPPKPVAVPMPPPPAPARDKEDLRRQAPVIVEFPDVDAEFPGGTAEMMKFIQENITYPPQAITDSIQGKVYLKAIVEADGTITDVVVERGVSPILDKEAIRIMYAMPKWRPGENSEGPVRTRIRMPFVFTLE